MGNSFHTIVVGGGCLGCAAAISLQRRLRRSPATSQARVCVIEKSVIGSGLTARHSGIVRAANAVPRAARMAQRATDMWETLDEHWGVAAPYTRCGAVWIVRDAGAGQNARWEALERSLDGLRINFKRVDRETAAALCTSQVALGEREIYFSEPGALQFDPADVRRTLYEALAANEIEVMERTPVEGFERSGDRITAVNTPHGALQTGFVVNAAGPWSPALFSSLGLTIPVSVEPVHVGNWLTSRRDMTEGMPIIADYVNLAYFRLWRDGEIHMHQPRKRSMRETARAFAENPMAMVGADFLNDPTNQGLGYSQIRVFEEIAQRRFSGLRNAVYGSGYRSYFDITPDLKFILGPDHRMPNLIHSLGAGQSFKYTPVFGEIVADCILGAHGEGEDLSEFAIGRFDERYMQNFWRQVAGSDHALETESTSL